MCFLFAASGTIWSQIARLCFFSLLLLMILGSSHDGTVLGYPFFLSFCVKTQRLVCWIRLAMSGFERNEVHDDEDVLDS